MLMSTLEEDEKEGGGERGRASNSNSLYQVVLYGHSEGKKK